MGAIVETLVFMVIAGVLWFIVQIKNLFGLGANVQSSQDALKNTLVFVVIAGVIYYILGQII